MADQGDALAQLEAELTTLGLPGFSQVAGAMQAAAQPNLDEKTRVAAVRTAYASMVDAALALVTTELAKVESLRNRTPESDPARGSLDDVLFAFHEQRDGLTNLRTFFATGEKALLHAAKEKLQRGAATARQASRAAGNQR